MTGADFLAQFGGTSDTVTRVDPDRVYQVRRATAHPVWEHDRVTRFRDLMLTGGRDSANREAGELLYRSHASYSACGLGSPGTNRLVELVRAEGPARGLYGARITGGGSGGTVVVLGRRGAESAIARVVDRYAEFTGHRPHVFAGSSPGVASCGVFDITV
jgi:L-arabinokinase